MDKDRFQEAKRFIVADIERELTFARAGNDAGNFLCALALLCYTEFMGGVERNKFERGEARRNFESFFPQLGPAYAALTGTMDVYDIFRCGLAHEYYVKRDCTIYMFGDPKPALGRREDRYFFVVEQYFNDFKEAVQALEARLYEDGSDG